MLNYVALGLLIFVVVFVFYAVIMVHDIPYEIAKKRRHPHQDAVHVAGWSTLIERRQGGRSNWKPRFDR
jgi:hypothetical protein